MSEDKELESLCVNENFCNIQKVDKSEFSFTYKLLVETFKDEQNMDDGDDLRSMVQVSIKESANEDEDAYEGNLGFLNDPKEEDSVEEDEEEDPPLLLGRTGNIVNTTEKEKSVVTNNSIPIREPPIESKTSRTIPPKTTEVSHLNTPRSIPKTHRLQPSSKTSKQAPESEVEELGGKPEPELSHERSGSLSPMHKESASGDGTDHRLPGVVQEGELPDPANPLKMLKHPNNPKSMIRKRTVSVLNSTVRSRGGGDNYKEIKKSKIDPVDKRMTVSSLRTSNGSGRFPKLAERVNRGKSEEKSSGRNVGDGRIYISGHQSRNSTVEIPEITIRERRTRNNQGSISILSEKHSYSKAVSSNRENRVRKDRKVFLDPMTKIKPSFDKFRLDSPTLPTLPTQPQSKPSLGPEMFSLNPRSMPTHLHSEEASLNSSNANISLSFNLKQTNGASLKPSRALAPISHLSHPLIPDFAMMLRPEKHQSMRMSKPPDAVPKRQIQSHAPVYNMGSMDAYDKLLHNKAMKIEPSFIRFVEANERNPDRNHFKKSIVSYFKEISPFFGFFSKEFTSYLLELAKIRFLSAGQNVVKVGDPCKTLWVVMYGILVVRGDNNSKCVIHGGCVGQASVLYPNKDAWHREEIRTLTKACILEISNPDVNEMKMWCQANKKKQEFVLFISQVDKQYRNN